MTRLSADAWTTRRDKRHKVLIRATMHAGGIPADVCIQDVSERGVCLVSAHPPRRGDVVELTGLPVTIVGQVVWASSRRFGVKVGGRIDLPRLLGNRSGQDQLQAAFKDRLPPKAALSSDASRQIGRAMQFIALGAAAVAGALGIGHMVHQTLASAADRVTATLER